MVSIWRAVIALARSGIPLDTMMAASRTANRAQRLAHRSGGKLMAIAEAALAIDQHQVDVAHQRAMLKRVVEDDHLGMRDFAEQANSIDAAARDGDGSAKRLRHHHRLVAGLLRRKV